MSTAMGRTFTGYEASCTVDMTGTNYADASYRYEHEVVYIKAYDFTGTREDFLSWYVSCHIFRLDTIPPPQEW